MDEKNNQWRQKIDRLQGWEVKDGKAITKVFSFETFSDALLFVSRVGAIAEQEKHHPDIRIFNYNKVEIFLTTHSEGGLSMKDCTVAESIDTISD